MAGKVGYDDEFKLQVLEAHRVSGNISATCRQYGINRQTLYNWLEDEEGIKGRVSKDKVLDVLVERDIVSGDVLKDIERYEDLLREIGIVEERKKKLGSKVEYLLFQVIDLLENHPQLDKVMPKDLSKIMTDLEAIRQKMYNEPDVVIEFRDEYQKNVLYVLNKMGIEPDKIKEFVRHMKALEADYEVIS